MDIINLLVKKSLFLKATKVYTKGLLIEVRTFDIMFSYIVAIDVIVVLSW